MRRPPRMGRRTVATSEAQSLRDGAKLVENDQAAGRPGWGGGNAPSPHPGLGPQGGRESKEELSFHGFRDAQGLSLHPRLHTAAPPGPEGITSARAICIPDGMAGRKAVDLSPKGFNSLAQGSPKDPCGERSAALGCRRTLHPSPERAQYPLLQEVVPPLQGSFQKTPTTQGVALG
jgi:hypothetical protein